MQRAKIIKIIAIGVATIWLVGCSSKGENKESTKKTASGTIERGDMGVITLAVQDEAVQAVIDSKMIDASSEQIDEMLHRNMFKFDFDSSKLGDSDYHALDVQAIYLNSKVGKDVSIVIHGHTDERGTRTYNLALGERRGNALKNYLVSQGVASYRISVISFGFEKPLDIAHTPDAWNKNRRAFIILSKESSDG